MTAIGTAGAGRDPITEAEMRVAQMQEQQLAAAEASPEAERALRAARTRAVLRVAARLNATTDQLWHLESAMAVWSVEVERAGDMRTKLCEWNDLENNDGSGEDGEWEYETLFVAVDELWADVVLECDEWARRVLT